MWDCLLCVVCWVLCERVSSVCCVLCETVSSVSCVMCERVSQFANPEFLCKCAVSYMYVSESRISMCLVSHVRESLLCVVSCVRECVLCPMCCVRTFSVRESRNSRIQLLHEFAVTHVRECLLCAVTPWVVCRKRPVRGVPLVTSDFCDVICGTCGSCDAWCLWHTSTWHNLTNAIVCLVTQSLCVASPSRMWFKHSDSVSSKDGHLPWSKGRKRVRCQWIYTGLVAPRGQRLIEHQGRTTWWARHRKDTANNHLEQRCLY